MLAKNFKPPKRARNPPYNWVEQKKKKKKEREREKRNQEGTSDEGAVKEKSSSHPGKPPY